MIATATLIRNPKIQGSETTPKMLVLRVTFDREPRIYSIVGEQFGVKAQDVLMTEEEFVNARKKEVKIAVDEGNKCLAIANSIIKELGNEFTFKAFKREYDIRCKGKIVDKSLFLDFAKLRISKFGPDKIGTAKLYQTAVKALDEYQPNLKLCQINTGLIDSFADYLIKVKKVSENTKRIYLREIKAIYHRAVKDKQTADRTPFINQTSTSSIRAKTIIQLEDIAKLLAYQPVNDTEKTAMQFFKLFLWLGGPNLVDILKIKNQDIDVSNSLLTYVRQKTKDTDTQVKVYVSKEAMEIFNSLGVVNPNAPDSYVIPIYRDNIPFQTQYNIKKTFCKKLNASYAEICKKIGVPPFTTYHIRHTASSILRDNAFTSEQIQKLLGHTSVVQTQTYLNSINYKKLKEMSDCLGSVGKEAERELEYMEEFRKCSSSGTVGDTERRLLNKLYLKLGITPERAAELEESVTSVALKDEEKEYADEVRAAYSSGDITEQSRGLLDKLRNLLGISEEKSREIEEHVLKTMK